MTLPAPASGADPTRPAPPRPAADRYRFPPGRYFSVIGNIRLGAGGQTRMALLRHRLMATEAGIDMPLVTFNPVPTYDDVRAGLLDEGLLLPDSRILNLHESLRDLVHARGAAGAPLPHDPGAVVDETHAGRPWRTSGATAEHGTHWEYLRPDGTRYLRTPADRMNGPVLVLDHRERVVVTLDGLGALWRWWLRSLLPDAGHTFLISDSRFIADELGLLQDPRVLLLHQVHNPHQTGERRWNSPLSASYADFMHHLDRCDAVSLLTERQRTDVVRRFGATDHLVVIPNPVAPAPVPAPTPARVPGRIVMVARLDGQKRIDRAVEAFAALADSSPQARLDVYGDGPDRTALRERIDAAGLGDRITLHGHVAHAADQFWTADLAWLTSDFEGFGLAILEARVRACPMVSMDMPYGTAEQIDSGVDGVLVPLGDTAALARATEDLWADRPRLEAMRSVARAGALAHGYDDFLTRWAAACADAVARKPSRTRLDALVPEHLVWRPAAHGTVLRARLRVEGRGDPDALHLAWQAWLPDSPGPVDLPVHVTMQVEGGRPVLTVRGQALSPESRVATRFALDAPGVRARLLVTWHNSAAAVRLEPQVGPARRLVRRIRRGWGRRRST